jgi:hypothetical protein
MCTMPLGSHLPGERFVEESARMQALILVASWCASVAVSVVLVHLIYGRHRPNWPDRQPSRHAESNLSPERRGPLARWAGTIGSDLGSRAESVCQRRGGKR